MKSISTNLNLSEVTTNILECGVDFDIYVSETAVVTYHSEADKLIATCSYAVLCEAEESMCEVCYTFTSMQDLNYRIASYISEIQVRDECKSNIASDIKTIQEEIESKEEYAACFEGVMSEEVAELHQEYIAELEEAISTLENA